MFDELDAFEENPVADWVADNMDWLMESFIEDNTDLYEAFMLQFGEDTHDNISQGFIDYHKEYWEQFCSEQYYNESSSIYNKQILVDADAE